MTLTDIYMLSKRRSAQSVLDFLNAFCPMCEESATEYEFPQYSEAPVEVFNQVTELMHRLEQDHAEAYLLYWDCLDSGVVKNAIASFTQDGGLILGLSVNEDKFERIADWLERMNAITNGQYGYATFEEPPVETIDSFLEIAKSPGVWSMVNGTVKR
jgi:hypothetical protein